jgi:hypothetical protein
LVVLVSGTGSNLQALLDATADAGFGAQIVAVGADRDGIAGLDRARAAGIPTFVRRVKDFPDRSAWDEALAADSAQFAPDLIVSAGFMKLLGPLGAALVVAGAIPVGDVLGIFGAAAGDTGGAVADGMAGEDTGTAVAESGSGSGDHIVLGLRNYGLEQTAAKVGGRTLLNDPDWMATLQKGIGNSSTRFTVSTDGMSGSSTYSQIMSAAQRGAAGTGSFTDWEMAQLFAGSRLPDVNFVGGGIPIENPFG